MIDYNKYLTDELNRIVVNNSLDCKIYVVEEQGFIDDELKSGNNIYFVLKRLSASVTYEGKTQPIQITAVSEENAQEVAQYILTEFAESHNWVIVQDTESLMKQQYFTPVVLSNFNEFTAGFRSVMYMSGTIFILEDVIDLSGFSITIGSTTTSDIKPLSFQLSYAMQGNTQPVGGSKISTTTKSTSTVSLSFALPMKKTYSNLINYILNIAKGVNSGNTDFSTSFTFGDVAFTSITFKCVSAVVNTQPNAVPSLMVGFME